MSTHFIKDTGCYTMIFTFYYIQKCKVKQLKRFSSVLKDLCVLKSFSHYLTIITVFCKTPLTGFSCIVGPILYTFNTVRLVSFTGAFYLSLMTLKIKYTFIGLYNMVVYTLSHDNYRIPRLEQLETG